MLRFQHWVLAAGLVATAAVIPPQVSGQRSSVEIWSANCGRCHTIQPPNRYSAKDWASIATHMGITARLTEEESDAVRAFLIAGARTVGSGAAAASGFVTSPTTVRAATASLARGSETDPKEVYDQQCAACHGENAKGDGPAAPAFNPRPTDMSVPAFWDERTDAQIDSVLVAGKGAMPSMNQSIDAATRRALIEYLREKYGGGAPFLLGRTEGLNP